MNQTSPCPKDPELNTLASDLESLSVRCEELSRRSAHKADALMGSGVTANAMDACQPPRSVDLASRLRQAIEEMSSSMDVLDRSLGRIEYTV